MDDDAILHCNRGRVDGIFSIFDQSGTYRALWRTSNLAHWIYGLFSHLSFFTRHPCYFSNCTDSATFRFLITLHQL